MEKKNSKWNTYLIDSNYSSNKKMISSLKYEFFKWAMYCQCLCKGHNMQTRGRIWCSWKSARYSGFFSILSENVSLNRRLWFLTNKADITIHSNIFTKNLCFRAVLTSSKELQENLWPDTLELEAVVEACRYFTYLPELPRKKPYPKNTKKKLEPPTW